MSQILAAILLAVVSWMAFKSLRAFTEDGRSRVRSGGKAKNAQTAKHDPKEPIESMRECPVCKTFRPVSRSTACGRDDCPYGT